MSQGYYKTKSIHESKVGTNQPGLEDTTITSKITSWLQA